MLCSAASTSAIDRARVLALAVLQVDRKLGGKRRRAERAQNRVHIRQAERVGREPEELQRAVAFEEPARDESGRLTRLHAIGLRLAWCGTGCGLA